MTLAAPCWSRPWSRPCGIGNASAPFRSRSGIPEEMSSGSRQGFPDDRPVSGDPCLSGFACWKIQCGNRGRTEGGSPNDGVAIGGSSGEVELWNPTGRSLGLRGSCTRRTHGSAKRPPVSSGSTSPIASAPSSGAGSTRGCSGERAWKTWSRAFSPASSRPAPVPAALPAVARTSGGSWFISPCAKLPIRPSVIVRNVGMCFVNDR